MKSNIFFTLLLACALIISCSKEEKIAEPELTLNGGTLPVIEAAGGKVGISLTANKDWSASSGQSWCRVEPSRGTAGTHNGITITVDENTTPDERNAQITFRCESITKSLTITQKQKDAVTVSSSKVEVNDEGKTIEVEVKANVSISYEIEESAKSWITPVTTRALTSHILHFDVAENESSSRREGKIFIKGGELMDTVFVYQEGSKPTIVISKEEYTVGSDGEDITVQLRSNINYQIIMPQNAGWIKEISTKAYSDYTHYFKVDPNDTYDSRSAEIIFKETSGSVSDTIKITQLQKDVIIVAKNEYKIGSPETVLNFKVSTNIDFEVESSVNWIKYVPATKGLKDVEVKFNIGENTASEQREGIITISNGDKKQQIKVIQEGKAQYVNIVVNCSSFTIPKFHGNNVSGTIRWGDGSESEYKEDAKHEYSIFDTYEVVFRMNNVTEVELPDIVGIKELDFSNL